MKEKIPEQAKRAYCKSCHRPKRACICQFTCDVDNNINVLVLQHPTEVKQTKGTVGLLASSMSNIEVEIGEDFSANESVAAFIAKNSPCFLLYPNEHAHTLQLVEGSDIPMPWRDAVGLIIIDGTWKKAYRMFQLSHNLQQLPSLALPDDIECFYQIRKTKKKQALSSFEACVHALAMLEQNQAKYQPMIENFIKFNQFQLSFTPKQHHSNGTSE
ncbi:DTW domain-containing protein [Thalassotalea loyana]|uniref:tRNA-uridine aminocarboxypropyltransferase n=1 Tax=Thalassotalea loyana TaxID=280483 RepID=A0ABQ6HIB5_9GAMM|nr:tRNA-uridine aminocarboxypropyltransferase [Thalassotalea loyana]GLX86590.1 DTW domain-containing protein [Thalassotalea loyana]